jgi:hypothetical protein
MKAIPTNNFRLDVRFGIASTDESPPEMDQGRHHAYVGTLYMWSNEAALGPHISPQKRHASLQERRYRVQADGLAGITTDLLKRSRASRRDRR